MVIFSGVFLREAYNTGWLIFFGISVLLFLLSAGLKNLKRLWPAGILSLLLLYMIDSTFIKLQAFSYNGGGKMLPGLPTAYWLSGFFGGCLLARYYPAKARWHFPYIILTAGVFLFAELVMHWIGYFNYINWNPFKSYMLDVVCFASVIWFAQCFGTTGGGSTKNE